MSNKYIPTIPQQHLQDRHKQENNGDDSQVVLGKTLLNKFEIFGYKEGGFGIVYFVTDKTTLKEYAVKTYLPKYADSLPSVDQFKKEAAYWIGQPKHPNFVKAHFVEVIEGQPYLFMDYVDGGSKTSLREWLQNGPIAIEQAISFAYQLSLAMEFANRTREVAHCDLKPENLLIDKNGILKVTDFGLIQTIEVRRGIYPRLDTGTWQYAAPEQFKNIQAVNTQSDIYSFGIILYEMLIGKLPYPFVLSKESKTQFIQLSNFHDAKGSNDLVNECYARGVTHINGAGRIIGGCLEHFTGNRFRNFKILREKIEYEFKRETSDYKRKLDLNSSILSTEEDFQQALSLHNIERYSDALSIFNRLLKQNPKDSKLWLESAKSLLALGYKDPARVNLKRAIHIDPTLTEAKNLLETCL